MRETFSDHKTGSIGVNIRVNENFALIGKTTFALTWTLRVFLQHNNAVACSAHGHPHDVIGDLFLPLFSPMYLCKNMHSLPKSHLPFFQCLHTDGWSKLQLSSFEHSPYFRYSRQTFSITKLFGRDLERCFGA